MLQQEYDNDKWASDKAKALLDCSVVTKRVADRIY